MAGQKKVNQFKETVQLFEGTDHSIENPDMFVYNLETFFFAEVKKEKDVLREPQMCFMYLAESLLGIESKLIYLSDSDEIEPPKMTKLEFDFPMDLENQMTKPYKKGIHPNL